MDETIRGNPFNYTQCLATSDQRVDLNSSEESIQSSRLSILDERIRSEPDAFIEQCKRVMELTIRNFPSAPAYQDPDQRSLEKSIGKVEKGLQKIEQYKDRLEDYLTMDQPLHSEKQLQNFNIVHITMHNCHNVLSFKLKQLKVYVSKQTKTHSQEETSVMQNPCDEKNIEKQSKELQGDIQTLEATSPGPEVQIDGLAIPHSSMPIVSDSVTTTKSKGLSSLESSRNTLDWRKFHHIPERIIEKSTIGGKEQIKVKIEHKIVTNLKDAELHEPETKGVKSLRSIQTKVIENLMKFENPAQTTEIHLLKNEGMKAHSVSNRWISSLKKMARQRKQLSSLYKSIRTLLKLEPHDGWPESNKEFLGLNYDEIKILH